MGMDLPPSTTSRDQALALFVQRLERRFSPVAWWRWWRWSRSPDNRRAYSEVQSLWDNLHELFESEMPVVTQHPTGPAIARATALVPRWQAVAMVVVTVFALGLLATAAVYITERPDLTIVTAAGQWEIRRLDDGTTAHVGPRTRIEVSLGGARRTIHLIEGEAWFDVAKDPVRPFDVGTMLGTVRATGTIFGITQRNGQVIVTVSEGSVLVSKASDEAGGTVLIPGQQVRMTGRGPMLPRFVNTQREFDWARGRVIDVTGLTVAEVANDLNERNRQQIRIDDPGLAAMVLPFLVIPSNDPDTFVHYMTLFGSIRAVRESRHAVRLEYIESSSP